MKQLVLRLIIATVTFAVGVTCAIAYHTVPWSPWYQTAVLQAKERTLRENLIGMRKAIDQYAAENGFYPESLAALAQAGYIREGSNTRF